MSDPSAARPGRPKASSRETLAEAACELFLEQGFATTSVAEITRRAGVSRSSFFNYFSSKSDILWAAFDDRVEAAIGRLAAGDGVRTALGGIGDEFAPDSLALAVANAEAMGIEDELAREASVRRARIAQTVARRLEHDGVDPMRAEVAGAAYAAAVLAAVWSWAHEGAGRMPLEPTVRRALSMVPEIVPD